MLSDFVKWNNSFSMFLWCEKFHYVIIVILITVICVINSHKKGIVVMNNAAIYRCFYITFQIIFYNCNKIIICHFIMFMILIMTKFYYKWYFLFLKAHLDDLKFVNSDLLTRIS
jgi:hypothetical protein